MDSCDIYSPLLWSLHWFLSSCFWNYGHVTILTELLDAIERVELRVNRIDDRMAQVTRTSR